MTIDEQTSDVIAEIKGATRAIRENVEAAKLIYAIDSINKMLKTKFFSICEVTKLCDDYDIKYDRSGEVYEALGLLHCIDFDKMSNTIRDSIPLLIAIIIAGEKVVYGIEEPDPKKPDFRRILGFRTPGQPVETEHFGATLTMLSREDFVVERVPKKKGRSFWKFIFGDLLKDDPE